MVEKHVREEKPEIFEEANNLNETNEANKEDLRFKQ